MIDIKTWLETIGLKVSEECFVKPPALPYIIFTEDNDVSGADDKNLITSRSISVELYSTKIDKVSEKLIEDLLNEKAIQYSKDRIWIDVETLFEAVFDFKIIEKL